MAGKRSRNKGCCGERELCIWLRKWKRFDTGKPVVAKRGFQSRGGGKEEPDIVHDIPRVHIECKRREDITVYGQVLKNAVKQAWDDAPIGFGVAVFWRRSRMPWLVTFGSMRGGIHCTVTAEDWMFWKGNSRLDAAVK